MKLRARRLSHFWLRVSILLSGFQVRYGLWILEILLSTKVIVHFLPA
jgi:hypothetical protein